MPPTNDSLSNSSTNSAQKRQVGRIVPAIPRQLTRAPTVKKNVVLPVAKPLENTETQKEEPARGEPGIETNTNEEILRSGGHDQQVQPDAEEAKAREVEATNGTPTEVNSSKGTSDASIATPNSQKTLSRATSVSQENEGLLSTVSSEKAKIPGQFSINGRTELPPPFYPSSSTVSSNVPLPQFGQYRPSGNATMPDDQLNFGNVGTLLDPLPTPQVSAQQGAPISGIQPTANGTASLTNTPNGNLNGNGTSNGAVHQNAVHVSPCTPQEPFQTFYPQSQQNPAWTHLNSSSTLDRSQSVSMRPSQSVVQQNGGMPPTRSGSQTSMPPAEQASNGRAYAQGMNLPQPQPQVHQSHQQFHPSHRHQNSDFRSGRHPSVIAENNLWSLQGYLGDQFGQAEFADCELVIGDQITIPSHAVILARIPRLRALLRDGNTSQGTATERRSLPIPDTFFFRCPEAFVEALRYVYGGPLLNESRLVHPYIQSPIRLLENVLSYAASGCTLGIPEIAVAALTIVSQRLTWDNLETALDFACQGGINRSWRHSSQDHHSETPDTTSKPKYEAYSTDVLEMVIRFACWSFPPNYVLDPYAPQLLGVKRFPDVQSQSSTIGHSSRASMSDPRLRGIQLGSFQTQSSASTLLSSILLSVPTAVVQAIFDDLSVQGRIDPAAVEFNLRQVVEQREIRRKNAAHAHEKQSNGINGRGAGSNPDSILHLKEEVQIVEQRFPRLRIITRSEGSVGT